MAIISKRLSKGEKACLAMVAVGLVAMLCGALYMLAVVMFATRDTPMSVWCLVSLTAGFGFAAVGMNLEPRVNANRIAAEAIAKARG
jgi:hypothetical protein